MAEDRSLFYKDPDEKKDFMRDWSAKLGTTDTVAESTWAADDDLTVVQSSFTDTTATVRVSGGPTIGVQYLLTNHIVTANGRELDKTFKIQARAH